MAFSGGEPRGLYPSVDVGGGGSWATAWSSTSAARSGWGDRLPAILVSVEGAMRRRPTEEEIAARAYELYEQHGAVEGRALDDWLQAKAELEAAETSAESREVRPKPRSASRRGGKASGRK
jgi:hypothetical protein